MKNRFILSLTVMLYIASLCGVTTIDLEESIVLSLENNKELRVEEKSYKSAQWNEYNVFSNLLPQAYLNTTAVRIDDKTYERATDTFKVPVFGQNNMPTGDYIPFSAAAMNGLHRTTYRTNITVQQPVFNGGQIFFGYRMARLARRQAENSFQNREREITHRVTDLYFSILKMQDILDTVKKNRVSAESHLQKLSRMKEAGMARQADVLQWQVRRQEYLTTQLELEYNIDLVLELWNNLLGFSDVLYHPARIDITAYEENITRYSTLTEDQESEFIERNVRAMLENNPQINTNKISKQIVRKNYLIAKGSFLPSLNLQFNYELENDDKLDFSGDRNWNIAAVLSFPIFRGGANYTNLRRARIDKRQVEYATSALEDYLITETKRVSREVIINAVRVRNNQTGLEYARQNYEILYNLFEQGMITGSEFLDAETMLFAGESNVIASYYDFILANYELYKYTTIKGVK